MILGIIGESGHGKDAFADMLMEIIPFKKASFAGPLKDFVSKWTFVPREKLDCQDGKKERNPVFFWTTNRVVLQEVGMFFRKIDKNWWIKKAMKKCNDGGLHVFTDVRFQNEMDAIMSNPSNKVIKVVRTGLDVPKPMNHPSENWAREKDDVTTLYASTIEELKDVTNTYAKFLIECWL